MTDYQNEILNLYEVARFEGEETKGRRFIRWRFTRDLDEDHTTKCLEKIRENVRTSFYMRHVQAYRLQNTEDKTIIIYYKNKGSPWMNTLSEAEKWLRDKEAERVDTDNSDGPTTKWRPLDHFSLDLKVVLDRQPLMGTGPLPDWLRNLAHAAREQAMVALDAYQEV